MKKKRNHNETCLLSFIDVNNAPCVCATEHFHGMVQCQLSCGIIARPIVPSLEKKELNVLGVHTVNYSFKAKMYSIFQFFNLEMKMSLKPLI